MGPRPRGRGIGLGGGVGQVAILVLQWGHDRAVVELDIDQEGMTREGKLQWGHDRAVVELMKSLVR